MRRDGIDRSKHVKEETVFRGIRRTRRDDGSREVSVLYAIMTGGSDLGGIDHDTQVGNDRFDGTGFTRSFRLRKNRQSNPGSNTSTGQRVYTAGNVEITSVVVIPGCFADPSITNSLCLALQESI